MNKVIRVILPIFLALVIILCTAWYLFVYDRPFTIDALLSCARFLESQNNHKTATWFYNLAYSQADNDDSIAIELANQYKSSGNYTKAEYTLVNAIEDGGSADLYIALSKTYVEQDKLLDAVTMLNQISNKEIKKVIESMRPKAPTVSPDAGFYREYISVTVQAETPALYVTGNGIYPSTQNSASNHTIQLVDGVNTISAIAVDNNGLVSPLAKYEFTVGGVIKEVQFADEAVELEVRRILGMDQNEPVFTNQIWTILDFTMPKDATSYADLMHFSYLEKLVIEEGLSTHIPYLKGLIGLKELTISDTAISSEDLAVIAALPELQKVTLQNCNLSNIDPLAQAKKLVYLDLNNNIVRDISALAQMSQLTELHLQHNAIVDLSALSGLTTLSKLNVSSNALTSLSPITGLSKISELDASTNTITSMGNIGNMTGLTVLKLAHNTLTDVSALSNCVNLTELNISNNMLESVNCLGSLKELLYVDFSFNKVTSLPKLTDCSLVSVNGANNSITSIDNLAALKQLNTVNMDYNAGLKSISALADCRNLVQVNVYGTKVTSVKSLTDNGIIVNYNPVQ